MKANRLKTKLSLFYAIFFAPAKEWQWPKKADILVYDACGAETLMPLLKQYHVNVMPVRGENINVPCLLRASVTLNFWKVWKYNPFKAYTQIFIQTVSPKVVITFIDNNSSFYEISMSNPDIKTILIQNGLRDDWLRTCTKKYNFHVDHMLVFGSGIGKYYQEHISGTVLPIGSLRANAVDKSNSTLYDSVLFISQYRERPKNNAPIYADVNGSPIHYDQFYLAEVRVLKFLAEWCSKNGMSLRVAGISQERGGSEREFFEAILNECRWEYLPRVDQYSSYKAVDEAEIVVFIDSTLGYESIARGKRTAALTCRGLSVTNYSLNFGWPADLPNNGPFWTNDQDNKQFQRVMDYLGTVSDFEWEQTRNRYANQLMEFDPGNTRFTSLLKHLLPLAEKLNHAN